MATIAEKIGCYVIVGAMFLLRCALVSKSEVIFLLMSIGLLALCIV